MSTVKQVIIIRRDLRMRRGKEIAQGAHASMEWLRKRILPWGTRGAAIVDFSAYEKAWLEGDYRKVVCQVQTEEELLNLYQTCQEWAVEANLVYDLGATEFHGQRTLTALAIGPHLAEAIDPITSGLVLY